MVKGVLCYDRINDRYQIRYGLEEYIDLHCGDTFRALSESGKWIDTRIEYSHETKSWYLIGFYRGYILDNTSVEY